MSTRTFITLPEEKVLEHENGWTQDKKNKNIFWAVRKKYCLINSQIEDEVRNGDIVDSFSTVKGVKQTINFSWELEIAKTDIKERIKHELLGQKAVGEFNTSIGASIGFNPVGKANLGLIFKKLEELNTAFETSFKVTSSKSNTIRKIFSREIEIDPKDYPPGSNTIACCGYVKKAWDLYLVAFDFLRIEYKRPKKLSLKHRRYKQPAASQIPHKNVLECNLPLVRLEYWEQLESSLMILSEKEYKNEVRNPFDIKIKKLTEVQKFYSKLPLKPTLYELSNKAFALKR